MANVNVYQRISSIIDQRLVHAGSLEIPATFSLTNNDRFERSDTVLNSVTDQVIYSDELASFNILFIASDFNTDILLTDTASNTFRLNLRGSGTANKLGPALILCSDTTTSGNEINSVKISNSSGSTAHYYFLALD